MASATSGFKTALPSEAFDQRAARTVLQVSAWSGRRDSNPGPPEPHSGTLPDCATSRPSGAFEQARPSVSNGLSARILAMKVCLVSGTHFSAAHRLYREDWDDERNQPVFDK